MEDAHDVHAHPQSVSLEEVSLPIGESSIIHLQRILHLNELVSDELATDERDKEYDCKAIPGKPKPTDSSSKTDDTSIEKFPHTLIDELDKSNVLESHLIDTYDEFQDRDRSVGIRELSPSQDELTQNLSETNTEAFDITYNGKAHGVREDIKSIAERLVNEIEQKVIEIVLKTSNENNISRQTCEIKINNKDNGIIAVPENEWEKQPNTELKIIHGPLTESPLEVEERKLFIESLPHIEPNTDANKLSTDCKQEYYKSLRKYLHFDPEKPPVPLQTYRWEDLRRAKERGGYPWTHLYKRTLGVDEEPEIVLLLSKSQELRFASESPRSFKKVRIDDQLLVKKRDHSIQEEETEDQTENPAVSTRDDESYSLRSECISCKSDSVLATNKSRKPNRLREIRKFLKDQRGKRLRGHANSLPHISANASTYESEQNLAPITSQISQNTTKYPEHKNWRDNSVMKKLKSMADRQKKRLHIKRAGLKGNDNIFLTEETKILNLKNSPKTERSEIAHFIEKQDSDDILEIVELDESPRRKRRADADDVENQRNMIPEGTLDKSNIVEPDEVIDIMRPIIETDKQIRVENSMAISDPPKKAPRLRREHVYEEIAHDDKERSDFTIILQSVSTESLKKSLAKQDSFVKTDIIATANPPSLDRLSSLEEDQTTAPIATEEKPITSYLAPISSIDSTSSDEDRNKTLLESVAEETDAGNNSLPVESGKIAKDTSFMKEAPLDKRVSFSEKEDEAEPHREDIELPDDVKSIVALTKTVKTLSDHEYEPIGVPLSAKHLLVAKDSSSTTNQTQNKEEESKHFIKVSQHNPEESNDDFGVTTASIEFVKNNEIQTDSSSLEVPPAKTENRKGGFIATAQDRTRKLQTSFMYQAGRIKSKLRAPTKAMNPEATKEKDQKRFKAPDFSKFKISGIKSPDIYKLRELKCPEFKKFHKSDKSSFKLPLKLKRSRSLKENETAHDDSKQILNEALDLPSPKRKFEFKFGTYPRAFRKKKTHVESESLGTETGTDVHSLIPSTETQLSMESSRSPQGDRGPGPVRSCWAHKISDISCNDSEGSRYRRYNSEQESFDRESSIEGRMKEVSGRSSSEAPDIGILGSVTKTKQFAEFDEENRAIHKISNLRAGEFKRRPLVHQDSDIRSENSMEPLGWTDREVENNKLLQKAEQEAEASYLKYPSEEIIAHETQSLASSGKKVVMEEIDDDEFFLRKRGISEDNIDLRQYISDAIREEYDMPLNGLEHVGRTSERIEFGLDYKIAPPKPQRLLKSYQNEDVSQEFQSERSVNCDDFSLSQNGSDFFTTPKPPTRKRRSRSKYSMDSQDFPAESEKEEENHKQYFEDDEEYLRPPHNRTATNDQMNLNNLNTSYNNHQQNVVQDDSDSRAFPQPPTRRKHQQRESSIDKHPYLNEFTGRSISNSYLQSPEDGVIVYRTEHEYHIPLTAPERYADRTSATPTSSRFTPDFGEDDHTFKNAENLASVVNLKNTEDDQDKFIINMTENDGYAVVRKEYVPKPTPPARRKKFTRSSGERFATMPDTSVCSAKPPERPPPPKAYTPTADEDQTFVVFSKSTLSLDTRQNYEDDYEEEELIEYEKDGSPRNLQSGEIINKMKFRPLPPPPRPPREKRHRPGSVESERKRHGHIFGESNLEDDGIEEIEVSTQTDPLPDDFVCEDFEITEDMKVIEPRYKVKTLDEIIRKEHNADMEQMRQMAEDEQLTQCVQRFRDANRRSLSEKSRASSQADRSLSLSRPQTPSAVVIEKRVSTPVSSPHNEGMLEVSLTVCPIDDLDLEEEVLRKEGLLSESSQSKSDLNSQFEFNEESGKLSNSAELITPIEGLHFEKELQTQEESQSESCCRDDNEELENSIVSDDIIKRDTISESLEFTDRHELKGQKVVLEDVARDEKEVLQSGPPKLPPRRKSTTAIDRLIETEHRPEAKGSLPEQTVIHEEQTPQLYLNGRLGELEVERLRVGALQAGQIMVSQLHGTQVSSDKFDCTSGNIIVQNLELPTGLLEDIVQRVCTTERRQPLTTGTQTNLEAGTEDLPIFSSAEHSTLAPKFGSKADYSKTVTTPVVTPKPPSSSTTPTNNETLKSQIPQDLYKQSISGLDHDIEEVDTYRRQCRRQTRKYSSSEDNNFTRQDESERVRHRSRSRTHPRETPSVTQATRQFISACSLSLARIINDLTDCIRGNAHKEQERQIPTLVVLFIVITFGLLIYLLSGKNIHTHHWDYFNPPGNNGRQT